MGDDDELEEVIPTGNGTANGADDREFDDWSEDTSADAVAKRQQDLSMGVKGLTITVELEKTPLERQELFYNFMEASTEQKTMVVHARIVKIDLSMKLKR